MLQDIQQIRSQYYQMQARFQTAALRTYWRRALLLSVIPSIFLTFFLDNTLVNFNQICSMQCRFYLEIGNFLKNRKKLKNICCSFSAFLSLFSNLWQMSEGKFIGYKECCPLVGVPPNRLFTFKLCIYSWPFQLTEFICLSELSFFCSISIRPTVIQKRQSRYNYYFSLRFLFI